MHGPNHTPDTETRLAAIERRIIEGAGLPELRQWTADTYGIGDRQARELVRTASQRAADDWELERPQLMAHRLTQLEALAQKAIAANQLAVALGAWKHADYLVGIAAGNLQRTSRRRP